MSLVQSISPDSAMSTIKIQFQVICDVSSQHMRAAQKHRNHAVPRKLQSNLKERQARKRATYWRYLSPNVTVDISLVINKIAHFFSKPLCLSGALTRHVFDNDDRGARFLSNASIRFGRSSNHNNHIKNSINPNSISHTDNQCAIETH